MKFASFSSIQLIWIIILVVAFLFWRRHRKQMIREKFADNKVLNEITKTLNLKREIHQIIFVSLLGIFAIIALMRPQWGFQWQEVKREGLDILVAIDTSKSMLTDDVKPNRLERSKLAIKDLVKKLEGDRIGLIAFSGDAFLVCPLTTDYQGFLLTLDNISTQTIPRGGTSIASPIKEAIRSFKDTAGKFRSMIIITDGEDLEGDVVLMADQARDENIKIFTIGIGTQKGELIRIQKGVNDYEFLKDQDGNFVKSRLNEKLLKEISVATSAAYVKASGAQFGLEFIYDQYLSKMEKREIKRRREKRFYERFQYPLFLAFVFLCIETLIPTRKE